MSFNTIELFMWGYQRHFQISVQNSADEVFKKLDPGLEAKACILGVLRKPEPGWHPICLEPPHCGFKPSDFSLIRENAAESRANDGDENLMSTTEAGMNAIKHRRDHRANRAAVMGLLEKADPHGERNYYFSGFIPVAKYDVAVILSVTHRDALRGYQLPKSHADESYSLPTSLEESVAGVFLRECLNSLHVPNPEIVDRYNGSRAEEILRKAGDRLMEVPIFAGNSFGGLYGLFNACNYIASLSYEGAESVGGMIIARDGHPNVSITIQLSKPIRLEKYRAIRKLLEITTTGESILTDGEFVTGFGKVTGSYDPTDSDLFVVRFTGHHKWELLHDRNTMMVVKHEVPRMPSPMLIEADFISACAILFPNTNSSNVTLLYHLALSACKQRHGTILVITPFAKEEAERMSSQSTGIVPTAVDQEILHCVSSIDGAVLIDMDGLCHAIGVILDGSAIPNGDTGRGARYNSTLRYIHGMKERNMPCLAVVVSEDGTAELMPALQRQIGKDDLDKKEQLIDGLLEKEEHDFENSFYLFKWLEAHRFYLSNELCEKANKLALKHEQELKTKGAITISRKKFTPNPEMSDAFLI